MTDSSLPIPNSYWVLRGQFLAGEYPGSFEPEKTRLAMDTFLRAGFDTFIDLTQPDEMPPYLPILTDQARAYGREITHHRFSIFDRGLPSHAEMITALNALDAALMDGHRTYIHCWGGVGRTGTAVGCYLVRHGQTGAEALRQIADWWKIVPKSRSFPRSPETDDQVQFILKWNEAVRP